MTAFTIIVVLLFNTFQIRGQQSVPICYILPDSEGHVIIPDGDTTISELAFFMCAEIKSVFIPASVTRIENGAFFRSGFREVIFEANSKLRSIGNNVSTYIY